MFWRILPHATACVATDRIIVLDLRQDRYFFLPPAITEAAAQWLYAEAAGASPASLDAMLARGAVWKPGDPAPAKQRCALTLPVTLEGPAARVRAGLARHARIDAILAATWIGLRLMPLIAQLERQARRSACPTRLDSDSLREHVAVFEQARRFSPIKRNCLLDSLALARWLASAGHGCRIIFGVAATPFAAHCWLQDEQTILNDHYDRVSRFTPIYAS
jgi:hypothetical protein